MSFDGLCRWARNIPNAYTTQSGLRNPVLGDSHLIVLTDEDHPTPYTTRTTRLLDYSVYVCIYVCMLPVLACQLEAKRSNSAASSGSRIRFESQLKLTTAWTLGEEGKALPAGNEGD